MSRAHERDRGAGRTISAGHLRLAKSTFWKPSDMPKLRMIVMGSTGTAREARQVSRKRARDDDEGTADALGRCEMPVAALGPTMPGSIFHVGTPPTCHVM